MLESAALFEKLNFEKKVPPTGAIDNIEKTIGFNLPDDYKYFLSNYAGFDGFVGSECLVLWDAEELLHLNEAYEISSSLPGLIAIGSNGAGEFIGIEISEKDNYRCVICPFIGLDKNDFHEIGNSFSDMLVRLDSGVGYFDN